MFPSRGARLAGAAVLAAVPLVLAYRFALVYRVRAGYPTPRAPLHTPALVGLPWTPAAIEGLGTGPQLPGWYMPAGGGPAPGVVLVHGWESSRDQLLPHAQYLHAVGYHVLAFDVRGNGANPPEALPVSVGEYAADALAAARWMAAREEVTRVALVGHSMGAAGSLVAAAADREIAAVVAISTPPGPERLTRQTFRLAQLPIPEPLAWPLAWLTTRVYLHPRRHSAAAINAARAVRRVAAPVLLVHGDSDQIVPVADMWRLAAGRRTTLPHAVTETMIVPGGGHSWLYESADFRATVARFLATALDGALSPAAAAERARAVQVERPPEEERLAAVDAEPGGIRSLLALFRPSETRLPSP